jgi:hypothetical protein
MRGGKMKRTWKRPELIVLVRPKVEENVLGGCKSGFDGSSTGNVRYNCKRNLLCGGCNSLLPS